MPNRQIQEALCVEWRNSPPRIAMTAEQRNVNMKNVISSSVNRTHNLSRLQTHACNPALRLAFKKILLQFFTMKVSQYGICHTATSIQSLITTKRIRLVSHVTNVRFVFCTAS